MKKIGFGVMAAALCVAGQAFAGNVTSVLARQQKPWNGKVAIDYRLEGGFADRFKVSVAVSNGTVAVDAPAATFAGEFEDVAPGEHRIVWDAAAAGFSPDEVTALSFAIVLEADLPKYLVIDLSAATSFGEDVGYSVSALSEAPASWTADDKTKKIILRRIRAGEFRMGTPVGEFGHANAETQHRVTISKDFYMAVFETTVNVWKLVMGTGYAMSYTGNDPSSRPAQNLKWNDLCGTAGTEADWPASTKVGETSFFGILRSRVAKGGGIALPNGYVLNLPSEAQWEYACRAGTTGAWNDGTDIVVTQEEAADSNLARLGNSKSGGAGRPDNVGQYLANDWGLYDMHGNVFEWCTDWYSTYLSDETDPKGSSSAGSYKMMRGGSWRSWPSACRSGSRSWQGPATAQMSWDGFRIALIPEF